MGRYLPSVLLSLLPLFLTACDGGSGGSDKKEAPNLLLFSATQDVNSGNELWATDGTTAGTRLIKDINTSGDSDVTKPVKLRDKWYFSADAGNNAYHLWVTDGSASGTHQVAVTNTNGPSNIRYITNYNGKLYFSASSVETGTELWVSDGTQAGTRLVKDIYPGPSPSTPNYFKVAGNYLYFSAYTAEKGQELWVTDGTTEGTKCLEIVNSYYGSAPYHMIALNGKLVFSAYASPNNQNSRLFVSDGTSVSRIKDEDGNDSDSAYPQNLTRVNDTIFYTAYSAAAGRELWKTDGITATLVKDISAGSNPTNFREEMFSFNNKLYFAAREDGQLQFKLWESDGTTAGTYIFEHGQPANQPSLLGSNDSKLYFSAANSGTQFELWLTDGTAEGTTMVKDINEGSESSFPADGVFFKNKFYFVARTDTYGREVWMTDGTTEGTTMLKDINPDSGSSYPAFNMSLPYAR